jgi:glycosyltransferase involved in cell wall biosynthesis
MKKLVLYGAASFILGILLLNLWILLDLLNLLHLFFGSLHTTMQNVVLPGLNKWSKLLILIGFGEMFVDILIFRIFGGQKKELTVRNLESKTVAVGMTAYNDELPIGGAVRDFLNHPRVSEVIVIDNNCTDRTAEEAEKAGAVVVKEEKQGYGFACMRALAEAAKRSEILALVEGDQTFSAKDLDKMIAYLENVDMVQGTRTTRELATRDSQLDVLMNLGNQVVAKLIQLRFWGVRLSDVGCTYRMITKEGYERIRNNLKVGGMYFSAHMMIEAFKADLKILEIPITFRKRVGHSKGVGGRKFRGMCVAMQMLRMIYFS